MRPQPSVFHRARGGDLYESVHCVLHKGTQFGICVDVWLRFRCMCPPALHLPSPSEPLWHVPIADCVQGSGGEETRAARVDRSGLGPGQWPGGREGGLAVFRSGFGVSQLEDRSLLESVSGRTDRLRVQRGRLCGVVHDRKRDRVGV